MGQLKRGCTQELIDVLKGHFHDVLLTEAEWPSGTGYFHSGFGDIVWNGRVWSGLGKYASWDIPAESSSIAVDTANVRIVTTLESMMESRNDRIRNLGITAYFGVTSEAGGNVLLAEPVQLFTGTYDSRKRTVRRKGDEMTHDLTVGVSIGPNALTSATITHSAEDQAAKFPGDTAGEKVINASKNKSNPRLWPEP